MGSKQRERFIGVHFNKKLKRFLNAIWHHEDLASLPLVTDDVAQVEEQTEEANGDKMGVEFEDMDMDENIYGDFNKGDDDDNDDDESDVQSTINGDSDDNVYIPSDDNENGVGYFVDSPERVEVFGSLTGRVLLMSPSTTILVSSLNSI